MVALILYAYARGNRSSRGIERECVEDIAYRVICANLVPDHSTIAEFRKRHEAALAGLFGEVLSLCREAGLVSVGVIAIDGTKLHANASRFSSLDYEQLARKILEEAARIDAEEDELHGEARGDELPKHLRTAEGRREALREAKRRLAERDQSAGDSAEASPVSVEIDLVGVVGRGRRGWLREGRHQLDERRKQEAQPIPRSRAVRLLEAERRMREDLAVENAANDAYEAWRADRAAGGVPANRIGGPTKAYRSPEEPAGKINVTDPDSRNVKTTRGWVQGYNAQAVVKENHIVIAAEVTVDSAGFGHLEPMIAAAERELEAVGITEKPAVAHADAGYWQHVQMQNIAARGIQVRRQQAHGYPPGLERWDVRVHAPGVRYRARPPALSKTAGAHRARVRRPEVQPQSRPLPTKRTVGGPLGVAITQRHPEPPQAPPPPDSNRWRLTRPQRPRPGAPRIDPASAICVRRRSDEHLSDSHRAEQGAWLPALRCRQPRAANKANRRSTSPCSCEKAGPSVRPLAPLGGGRGDRSRKRP